MPEMVIAEPKIFCGFPGERITYGDLTKNAAKIRRANSNLVGPGSWDLTGRSDLIFIYFLDEKSSENS